MSSEPDVVVVGAGVVGCSVAYHLARRGARVDVLGDGGPASTDRATGGQRAQFGTEVNVRLSLLARERLAAFRDETGVDPGLAPRGYLFVATSEAELAGLRAARDVQRRAGFMDAEEVSATDVRRLNPALSPDGILGGMFGASDGFISPREVRRGYREAAIRHGARFLPDRCRRLSDLSARWVVNAAGAWAGTLGLDLPVTPLRRQVAPTVPTAELSPEMPMTIFLGDGFHFRVRDGRVLLLLPSAPAADPWDTSVDPAWLDAIETQRRARLPGLRAPLDRAEAWAGLYEMSPDGHAILGPAPGVPHVILANGSSGHGVMHSPALGLLVSEMILDGEARSLDVSALAPDRFARGAAIGAHHLL
jgi:sarcosine oxidase subunit beta